jgi:hypothetical protein
MTGPRATIRGHDLGWPMSSCAFVSRFAMIGGRPQFLAEAADLAMLGGVSGCQRPNSEAMGAGKKAGACPDEAQSTAEAVFSGKLKCAAMQSMCILMHLQMHWAGMPISVCERSWQIAIANGKLDLRVERRATSCRNVTTAYSSVTFIRILLAAYSRMPSRGLDSWCSNCGGGALGVGLR